MSARANGIPVGLFGEARNTTAAPGARASRTIAATSREKFSRSRTARTCAPPTTASGTDMEYPGAVRTAARPEAKVSTTARMPSFEPLVTATISGSTPT